jgi:hypothetical protein
MLQFLETSVTEVEVLKLTEIASNYYNMVKTDEVIVVNSNSALKSVK